MSQRRVRLFSVGILLIIVLLFVRLMQIQLFQSEEFSKHKVNLLEDSVKQRTQQILIDDGRGLFLDSKGLPLSHEEKMVLILFPFLKTMDWDSQQLANIIGVSKYTLEEKVREAKQPFIYGEVTESQSESIANLNIPGVISVKGKWIPNTFPAAQLIGLTGENSEEYKKRYPDKQGYDIKIGVSGLQKQFDEFLIAEAPSKLVFHVDALGSPLFGIDVKYTGQNNPYYPLNVRTTIDSELQENLESILDKHEVQKGGAILLDVETGNIAALASRPSINWNDPYSDEGTKNMMFEQHIPGSVFKTVVAAAALDEGIVDRNDSFNCNLNIRGEPASRELGELMLDESFSRSCNRTFAELAIALQKENPNNLEEYARKLGLIGSLGWQGDVFYLKDFQQFKSSIGRIFLDNDHKNDVNFISQTGIGQHEVRVSPLGVANMMATISRGGNLKSIRVATEIQYADGGALFKFPEQANDDDSVSPATAQRLQQLLRKVVTDQEGTGAYFQNLPYEVAGKSGTAQTGIEIENQQLYNKWFAGYFPFQNPKYSLVTVNLDVLENEGSTSELFSDIVKMVHDIEESSS
ncbi:peptidoglycan D,D-transpeptidase FtsI family protein [Bacillus niameyensis]|uniref:peptidoglycan D,D-transpeptidase FtsI family protein n=1 Tax=Bacillus niameyensis TaxID=1522308 RepID=UPI000784BAD9|nr:penicillin-binding transpeptidase domain-containing protein [Bacillus niameyensis]